MITYIIKTNDNEFYCGKTENIDKRLQEHLKENNPHWFSYNNRKNIQHIIMIKGDYEKRIKSFGVKTFYNILLDWSSRSPLS